jgi:hypothetical protein
MNISENTLGIVGLVLILGAVGGFLSALMSDDRALFPRREPGDSTVYRYGVVLNTLVGAVAAFISWALYGANANTTIFSNGTAVTEINLTFIALGGAVLTGFGGSKLLTNVSDKQMLRSAATSAAQSQPSPELAQEIASAKPVQAMRLAKQRKSKAPAQASEPDHRAA